MDDLSPVRRTRPEARSEIFRKQALLPGVSVNVPLDLRRGLRLFREKTKDAFIFWFNLASLPNIIFYPPTVHFCLALTRLIPLRPVVYVAIYAPAIPLYYHAATGSILFKDFVKAGDYWEFLPLRVPLARLYRGLLISPA